MSNYNTNIVKKPWGYEYLAYENENVGLWFLYIAPGQSTSMHCHPKKTTGLVLLDGEAEVSFLADKRELKSLDKVMIRRGLFHSTKALSDNGAFVFEIETPVDKQDLVRLNDKYGRASKPYEDSTFEEAKNQDCLWIKDENQTYNFANCTLSIKNITDISQFMEIEDKYNVMFLNGGLQADYGQNVAGPGDVVSSGVIKQLTEVFTKVDPQTLVMIIKSNG